MKLGRSFLQIIALTLTLLQFPTDGTELEWAPQRPLQRPYLTLINDFFRPSWMSVDNQTFRPRFGTLFMPRNIYFGLICAACFRKRRKNYLVNLSTSSTYDDSFEIKGSFGMSRYWEVGKNECSMIYNVIYVNESLEFFTCNLNLNSKIYHHRIDILSRAYKNDSYGNWMSLIRDNVDSTDLNNNNNNWSFIPFENTSIGWHYEKTPLADNIVWWLGLECRGSDNYDATRVANKTNTTVWWYQSKGSKSIHPRAVSTSVKYPDAIAIRAGDKIGCATYEIDIENEMIPRVYEKIFHFTEIPESRKLVEKKLHPITFFVIVIIYIAAVFGFTKIILSLRREEKKKLISIK